MHHFSGIRMSKNLYLTGLFAQRMSLPVKCNPFGPGCKEEDPPLPNEFMDCPGKRCKQLPLEGENRSRNDERFKKAKKYSKINVKTDTCPC